MKTSISLIIIISIVMIRPSNMLAQIYSFSENGLYGYRNGMGEIVIEPKYDSAFNSGSVILNGKQGLINQKGGWIYEAKYDYLELYKNKGTNHWTQSIVGDKKKYGVIFKNNGIAIPIIYNKVERLHSGIYLVYNKKKIGAYKLDDKEKKAINSINPIYDSINLFSAGYDHYIEAFKNGKRLLFDSNLNVANKQMTAASKKKWDDKVEKERKEREESMKNQTIIHE